MRDLNFLPVYRQGMNEIEPGLEISVPDFCLCNVSKNEKCIKYYKDIFKKEPGVYNCPFGFNSYIFKNANDENEIFTCLRIIGKYDKKKVDPKIKMRENSGKPFRRLNESEIQQYCEFYIKYNESITAYESHKNFVENILHDIRTFNRDLKRETADVYRRSESSKKYEYILKLSKNMMATCAFMTLRLNAYDFMYNEELLSKSQKTSYNMFRIFDKVRKCLLIKAEDRGIRIELESNGTCSDMRAHECIELLPYIILDNAIKYSRKSSTIKIWIEDRPEKCNILTTSHSICLKPGEEEKIFRRSYRGENAGQMVQEGLGIGLYTAKKICDLHNAAISVTQEVKNPEEKFSDFMVDIKLNKDYNV